MRYIGLAIILLSTTLGCVATSPPKIHYQLLNTQPSDPQIYTQGLEINEDSFLISSGGYGRSWVERRNLKDFSTSVRLLLPPRFFAEGVTRFHNAIYLLSWESGQAWLLTPDTLTHIKTFEYQGQGWGLTHNSSHLIMSDGTSQIRFIDPKTFTTVNTITVTLSGRPLTNLNELEYHDGAIWANIWLESKLVKIDDKTGQVIGVLDLSELVAEYHRPDGDNVLNGIAWDEKQRGFWITGKQWPTRFLIRPTNSINAKPDTNLSRP